MVPNRLYDWFQGDLLFEQILVDFKMNNCDSRWKQGKYRLIWIARTSKNQYKAVSCEYYYVVLCDPKNDIYRWTIGYYNFFSPIDYFIAHLIKEPYLWLLQGGSREDLTKAPLDFLITSYSAYAKTPLIWRFCTTYLIMFP